MQGFKPRRRLRNRLSVLAGIAIVAAALAVATAHAQNLDQGKSATRLFADSCSTCHHNPRVLARGRAAPALYQFLREHYATGSTSAAELASYLASVDSRRGARSRPRTPRPARPVPSN